MTLKNIWCLNRSFCSKVVSWPKKFFSGIQPTGSVHLGNYFAAIRRWVELQNTQSHVICSVVDLHAITLPQCPQTLQENILDVTATLLACGVHPEKSILFQQSTVQQHTELCWILGTMTTMARLSQLPQYKEKSSTIKEVPVGLFVYPVLQAADILLYKATDVPVGVDQMHHIYLTQDLARIFNHKFGVTFPTPKVSIVSEDAQKIRSLRDPTKKMSKSEQDPRSRIHLVDPPDVILEKCKKAVTDCTSRVTFEPETRPGVSNLIKIHSLFTNKSAEKICEEVQQLNTGQYKLVLAEIVIECLKPIREKILEYRNSPEYLIQVLAQGKRKAEEEAETTMREVRAKVGFEVSNSKIKSNCMKETLHAN